jgi:hypothetical protein
MQSFPHLFNQVQQIYLLAFSSQVGPINLFFLIESYKFIFLALQTFNFENKLSLESITVPI